jgi:phospholipase C
VEGDAMKHRTILACLAAMAVSTTAVADDRDEHPGVHTATPIRHLVVIFQENISFDHYFGTYPFAQNNPGETPFKPSKRTPKSINNLLTPLDTTNHFVPLAGVDLINHNPNSNPNAPAAPNNGVKNGANAANPFRLSPAQALTADQNHNEGPEQSAYNNGLMDGFPAFVGTAGPPPVAPPAAVNTKGLVMGYFDGNTVTALGITPSTSP